MDPRKLQFLVAVLGEDGARALAKASERSQELGNVLVPRTIMAWLGMAGRDSYEGDIPGVINSYVQFTKNEQDYSGSVGVGEDVYTFENESIVHVAGAVAVALGIDHERAHPDLRDLDLARLGKSIDLLAKARAVAEKLLKEPDEESAEKAEGPGPAAAPRMQKPPDAPASPQLQVGRGPKASTGAPKTPGLPKPKLPKPPGMVKTLKITKSQAERKCSLCGFTQFKGGKFSGCLCLRDLAKHVKSSAEGEGFVLEIGAKLDEEERETLIESLGSP